MGAIVRDYRREFDGLRKRLDARTLALAVLQIALTVATIVAVKVF